MSLKEALQFLVTLAKEKKKEAARDQRKSVFPKVLGCWGKMLNEFLFAKCKINNISHDALIGRLSLTKSNI